MLKITTSRFGDIEVDEKKIVHFDEGIPAFEDEHEFVIVPYEENTPYYFMQSIKSPDLAFLLTIPFLFFPDYTFEIDDKTIKDLKIEDHEHVFYYSMITIPNGSIRDMTANLLAPIVLNAETMHAKQVVLDKSNYTTKHRLFSETAKKEG